MKNAWKALAAVCALVIGVYAYMCRSGGMESLIPYAAGTHYNLLVQGFRAGQLSLKEDVPPGLTKLADPYDPIANAPYRSTPFALHDMTYYKGRLYLYFGVTPALILFWPYVALTGQYLFHRQAVLIFCALGFLASVGLLHALWRRYFAEVSVGVVAACALALGLAGGVPMLLAGSEFYQVAISCGYLLTMLALLAIWRALDEPKRRCQWLAAASVAYGLAVGARPSLVFGAVILMVPVVMAWHEPWSRKLLGLLAATGPIVLIGLGLMGYNYLRFDDPLEFGMQYQLAATRQVAHQLFNLRYLWFNFRVYFLEPARWSARFPFVHEIAVLPLPPGHDGVEGAFGILTNTPLVWLALAAPLAWRNRPKQETVVLRGFVTATTLLFGSCALSLCLFRGAVRRYEVELLSPLLLLAAVGILGLEQTLAPTPKSGPAQSTRRHAVRWVWGLLLAFSVAFNLLTGAEQHAYVHYTVGSDLLRLGRNREAAEEYEQAVRIKPDFGEVHYNLGSIYLQTGNVGAAITHFHQALLLLSASTMASYGYAVHYSLGNAFLQAGRPQEAIEQYAQALQIKPDSPETHYNYGKALFRTGSVPEAITHYEQAVRLKPGYVEARSDLGLALEETGRAREAIVQYEQALQIKPENPFVQNNLAWLLATLAPSDGGDPGRAVTLAERICKLTNNQSPPYLDTLAAAYASAGRFNDAIATARKAIDLANAAGLPQVANQIEPRLQLYRNGQPYRRALAATNPPTP